MNIGIIGAGEIGGTLARHYTKSGHRVKIANASGVEKLKNIARETGALPVELANAVTDVDVIVISIPYFAVGNLPKGMFDDVDHNTTIIDTCNYYPIVSGVIQDVVDGMNESVWVATQTGRPVVKAYNSIFYRSLVQSGLPEGHPSRIALPISGDDRRGKEIVARLINESGFDSYDQGTLEDSWRQEPGSPAYCTDLTLKQLMRSISKARKELLPERRELGLKHIIELGPERWQDLVQMNRTIYESDLST
jgi:8-hydroxy-5-deazaflavin:NADPH oxidoreductase